MTFLASSGNRLLRYELDTQGALRLQNEIELPSPVHYAWPHSRLRLMYVACSARMFTERDDGHMLVAVEVPANGGTMRQVGEPVPLAHRTIHMTVDPANSYVYCLFNDPPGIQVHALAADGTIGAQVAQPADLDFGIYSHQVRVMPGNRWLLVVPRGYDPRPGRGEDPGALLRYSIRDGRLAPVQKVAPGGGYGFGPRHLDFHPTLPVIYVSLERQNQVHVYRHDNGVIEETPWQVFDTLAPGKQGSPHQVVGGIHVHPNGKFVYVANRDDSHATRKASLAIGDNTMAVYAADETTGALTPVGNSELDAWHVRTFSIRPPYLVAASLQDIELTTPEGVRKEPATLGVFRIGADGLLTRVSQTPVETRGSMLWWSGFPSAYGAGWA